MSLRLLQVARHWYTTGRRGRGMRAAVRASTICASTLDPVAQRLVRRGSRGGKGGQRGLPGMIAKRGTVRHGMRRKSRCHAV